MKLKACGVAKMEIKIIRKIDNPGRIVIPKDLRVMLRIALGDAVEITVKKNAVVIKKAKGEAHI